MKLETKLTKPVCFIKMATTGNNPSKDRIVELSITKFIDGKDPVSVTRRFNPGVEIPEGAIAIHKITDEDVKSEPLFKDRAANIAGFINDCDFIGFNIGKFDLRILLEEFNRSGIEFSTHNKKIIDLYSIYRRFNPSNFNAVAESYGIEVTENAASNQYVNSSIELFNNMMKSHIGKDLPTGETVTDDMETLNDLFNPKKGSLDLAGKIVLNKDGRPVFNFGKHKGKLISEICINEEPGYFNWLTTTAKDMPSNSISVLKDIVAKASKHLSEVGE